MMNCFLVIVLPASKNIDKMLYRSDYAIENMYIVCFLDGINTMLLIMNISLHQFLRYMLDLV